MTHLNEQPRFVVDHKMNPPGLVSELNGGDGKGGSGFSLNIRTHGSVYHNIEVRLQSLRSSHKLGILGEINRFYKK